MGVKVYTVVVEGPSGADRLQATARDASEAEAAGQRNPHARRADRRDRFRFRGPVGGRKNRYEVAAGRLASELALEWRVMRPRRNDAGLGKVYGQAWRGTLRFEAPRPNTARNLMMWLHEAAHVAGPFFGEDPLTVYAAEVKAYAWAFRAYRKALGERAPERLRLWAKRQLEGQHTLAIDAAFALVDK